MRDLRRESLGNTKEKPMCKAQVDEGVLSICIPDIYKRPIIFRIKEMWFGGEEEESYLMFYYSTLGDTFFGVSMLEG